MLEKVRLLALEPAPGQGHPCERDLARFMEGELPRTEAREIVRHLLTGCPRCKQVTHRLWTLSDCRRRALGIRQQTGQGTFNLLKWMRRDDTMTEAQAQAELQEIVRDLGAVCARLESIHDRLPVPLQETAMLLGEEEMDVSTEVRSVIECVVHDNLRPAMRDLAAAAAYLPRA